ncbi:hypothetical protein BS47DRAFT_1394025 [Hydnum rufescens UP504]|uniref:Uncharacterized protein n=1 Tax=Hydnum rufescens UP504 TaxID=1448309 RepID=A0A9P6AWL9_9AGAM|nr:hypothetical protein BS47DRAFT_1394025 [Hydnum rufescens UP504]
MRPPPSNVPLLSTTHSFLGVENGDTSKDDGSNGINETAGIDALTNIAHHLTLDVDDVFSRVPGIVELESMKQEEEEDDNVFLQPSRSTLGAFSQDGQNDAAARALAVKMSLMTLVTRLTFLLTRLQYSARLTKFTQEITSSLSDVTNKAGHMITLDNDVDRATRERDAKRY